MEVISGKKTFIDNLLRQYYRYITKAAQHHLAKHYPRSGIVAEDLVQETFTAAWRHAEELETHPNVVGWLIVTMKNRAMTAQRELDKQARIVDELSRIAQFPDTMDISLMELIETLSPADQEILTLYYVKNSKLRKITNLFLEANMAEEQERYKGQYTIFTNLDHLTAVWAQGFCEIVIQGDLTYEQLTQMLDSINE